MTQTVDRIVAGRPETRVRGIATTMMATLAVLQRAASEGRNLVVTHEPTFYSHQDTVEGLGNDPTYQAKQRFIAVHFDFPAEEIERKIVLNEAHGITPELAHQLVTAGRKARLLKDHGLEEAASTRALVYAANMMNAGLDPVAACQVAMVNPITDDEELAEALMEIVQAHFGT